MIVVAPRVLVAVFGVVLMFSSMGLPVAHAQFGSGGTITITKSWVGGDPNLPTFFQIIGNDPNCTSGVAALPPGGTTATIGGVAEDFLPLGGTGAPEPCVYTVTEFAVTGYVTPPPQMTGPTGNLTFVNTPAAPNATLTIAKNWSPSNPTPRRSRRSRGSS